MSRAQGNEGRSALCSHKSGSAFVPLHRAKPVRPSEQRPEGLCSEGLAARRTPPRAQAARPPARLRKPGPIPRAQAVRPPARLHKPGPFREPRPPGRRRVHTSQAFSASPGRQAVGSPRASQNSSASPGSAPPPGTGLLLTSNMPRTTRNSGGDSIYERLHENL